MDDSFTSIKHIESPDISLKRIEWCGSVAENCMAAVMLCPGCEPCLWRFGNKHTCQIEGGAGGGCVCVWWWGGCMRVEISQKITSNLEGLLCFSSTHICLWLVCLGVWGAVVLLPSFTGKCRFIMCERKKGRFCVLFSTQPIEKKKKICGLFAFTYGSLVLLLCRHTRTLAHLLRAEKNCSRDEKMIKRMTWEERIMRLYLCRYSSWTLPSRLHHTGLLAHRRLVGWLFDHRSQNLYCWYSNVWGEGNSLSDP